MSETRDWPALMSPETAAAYCDTSVRTLNRLRAKKEFPPPAELGESPRYRRTDLDAWIKKLRVAS